MSAHLRRRARWEMVCAVGDVDSPLGRGLELMLMGGSKLGNAARNSLPREDDDGVCTGHLPLLDPHQVDAVDASGLVFWGSSICCSIPFVDFARSRLSPVSKVPLYHRNNSTLPNTQFHLSMSLNIRSGDICTMYGVDL